MTDSLTSKFPTKLRTTNCQYFLTVGNKNEVTNRSLHSASICANLPIPHYVTYFYYEVTVKNVEKGSISLGLIPEHQFQSESPVGKKHGYGLRSDGRLFSQTSPNSNGVDWSFCSLWGNHVGDTVGCGVIVDSGEIFFTKGDKLCGVAFTLSPEAVICSLTEESAKLVSQCYPSSRDKVRKVTQQFIPCVTIGADRVVEVRWLAGVFDI